MLVSWKILGPPKIAPQLGEIDPTPPLWLQNRFPPILAGWATRNPKARFPPFGCMETYRKSWDFNYQPQLTQHVMETCRR